MTRKVFINVHSVIAESRVNGPGNRVVIFFQGCARKCPGCFNPDTHPFKMAYLYTPEEILAKYISPSIEGITISGGEPFYQEEGLFYLLKTAKRDYGVSTVVYTGFLYEDIERMKWGREIFKFTDVLIDGMYDETKKEPTLLARGSTNQRFIFFTGRYREEDFYMPGKVEVRILQNGAIIKTGFSKV